MTSKTVTIILYKQLQMYWHPEYINWVTHAMSDILISKCSFNTFFNNAIYFSFLIIGTSSQLILCEAFS